MNEEDEAFNEIERMSRVRQEILRSLNRKRQIQDAEYKDMIAEAVAAERQWLIDSGLIGVLKHCEDLLREDGHEDAVDDVQNMIAKIKARGQA